MRKTTYAAINKDETVRLNSSSGGIFSLLAEETITENGIVFGSQFAENFSVEHGYAKDLEGIKRFRGSKYVQSKANEAYKNCKIFLEENRKVLFSGLPCQIAGLKAFLGKEYPHLLCVDLICHGVPSPKIWETYLEHMKTKYCSEIQNINFRSKYYGWDNYSMEISFKNGKLYRALAPKDVYMKMYSKCIIFRPSCYHCKFKTLKKDADITIGDFWGIKEVCPAMYDGKGTSLVMIHTRKGEEALNKIKGRCRIETVETQEAIKHNPSIISSVMEPAKRKLFFENIDKMPLERLVRKYVDDSFATRCYRLGIKYLSKLKGTMLKHGRRIFA